jgi:signal peptidase II
VSDRRYGFYITILLEILFDQIAKLIVVATVPLFSSVTIIPNLVDITYVRNTGLAYGFLQDSSIPYKSVIVGALAVAALGGDLI